MNKNTVLPAAILEARCAKSASAGSYAPVAGYNPVGAECSTNLNNTFTGDRPTYTFSREMNDPPSTQPYYAAAATWESSLDFRWQWTPNGDLDQDPAPNRFCSYRNDISGQAECKAVGQARSFLLFNLNTEWGSSNGGHLYKAYSFDLNSDQGNQLVTLSGGETEYVGLDAAAGGYLSTTIKLQSNSHSHVDAYPDAQGIGRTTNALIKVTSMTLVS